MLEIRFDLSVVTNHVFAPGQLGQPKLSWCKSKSNQLRDARDRSRACPVAVSHARQRCRRVHIMLLVLIPLLFISPPLDGLVIPNAFDLFGFAVLYKGSLKLNPTITANAYHTLRMALAMPSCLSITWHVANTKSKQTSRLRLSCQATTPDVYPTTNPISSKPPNLTFRRLVARTSGECFRSVAQMESAPLPLPGEGEVLVRVAYAGINGGCETFRARGEHAFAINKTRPSFPLGAEGAGTIVAVGSGVSAETLCVGQAVTFVGGAFAEFVVAKAALCWPVPSPTAEAVALTISGTVANAALKKVAKIRFGDVVLVTAAGGATGSFAAQLAALAGCRVVCTCGGEAKARRLRRLGTLERVIDYTKEDVVEVLRREYRGKVDVAYEGVGGALQRTAWENLAPGGRLLVVGYISEYPHNQGRKTIDTIDTQPGSNDSHRMRIGSAVAASVDDATTHPKRALPPSADLFWKGMRFEGTEGRVALGSVWPSERSDTLAAKAELFDVAERGLIEAWVDPKSEIFVGLESVCDAVDYMLSGAAIGKVVVKL